MGGGVRLATVLVTLAGLGCAGGRDPRLIWVGRTELRVERASDAIVDLPSTAPGVRTGVWGDAAHATYQLIAAEVSERPHVHDDHDLTVVLLSGHGELRIDGAAVAMEAGDVVHVARGRPHHFHPASPRVVGLGIYSPRLLGRDSRNLGE